MLKLPQHLLKRLYHTINIMSSPVSEPTAAAAAEEQTRSNPQEATPQQPTTTTTTEQQPIAATTAMGVTAPKPKVDHSATDATIQGLLIQAIALQHNKIQQLTSTSDQ